LTFVIVGFHQKAVSTRSRGVTADAEAIGPPEEFDLIDCGGGLLAVRALDGRFLTAQPDGILRSGTEVLREWEQFRFVPGQRGRLGFLTHHGFFVSAQPSGALEANRTWLRDWEEFYVLRLPDVDEFAPVSQRSEGALRAPALFARCAEALEGACRDALAVVGGVTFPAPVRSSTE
jgi:hypothetical protein